MATTPLSDDDRAWLAQIPCLWERSKFDDHRVTADRGNRDLGFVLGGKFNSASHWAPYVSEHGRQLIKAECRYLGDCPFHTSDKPNDDDVPVSFHCMVLEIDNKQEKTREQYDWLVRAARNACHGVCLPEPNVVYASKGYGVRMIWVFDKPLTDRDRYERLVLGVRSALTSDTLPDMIEPSEVDPRPGDWTRRWLVTNPVWEREAILRPVEVLHRTRVDWTKLPEEEPSRHKKSVAAPVDPELLAHYSDDERVRRALAYTLKMPESVQGEGGSGACFRVACVLCEGFALDEEQAMHVMTRWNEERAHPPWSEPELLHKVQDALSQVDEDQLGYMLAGGKKRADDTRQRVQELLGKREMDMDTREHTLAGVGAAAHGRDISHIDAQKRAIRLPGELGIWEVQTSSLTTEEISEGVEAIERKRNISFDVVIIDPLDEVVDVEGMKLAAYISDKQVVSKLQAWMKQAGKVGYGTIQYNRSGVQAQQQGKHRSGTDGSGGLGRAYKFQNALSIERVDGGRLLKFTKCRMGSHELMGASLRYQYHSSRKEHMTRGFVTYKGLSTDEEIKTDLREARYKKLLSAIQSQDQKALPGLVQEKREKATYLGLWGIKKSDLVQYFGKMKVETEWAIQKFKTAGLLEETNGDIRFHNSTKTNWLVFKGSAKVGETSQPSGGSGGGG